VAELIFFAWTLQAINDNDSLREVVHGSYRIVYRLKAETIEILIVNHAARLLQLA
jgi:plasmid stabilization system protein ParE